MKANLQKFGRGLVILFLLTGIGSGYSQTQGNEEVPGDNFSLEGALELFKKSSSPEEFEKLLNSSDSRVNNLDLNADGDIDYIRVINRQDGQVHIFILQAVISASESQDVAVIELEKLGNGKAVLQITGDEDVYGIETIIEPTEEVRINAGTMTSSTVVNVWAWPAVQYVYSPYYSVWVSPWHWGLRPWWWRPWRPVAYYVYDPWWRPYRPYYSICYSHRVVYAHQLYRPYRSTSVIVYDRYQGQVNRYRSAYSDLNNGRGRHSEARMSGRPQSVSMEANGRTRSYQDSNERSSSGRSRFYSGDDNGSRGRTNSNRTATEQAEPVFRNRSSSESRGRSNVPQQSSRSFQQREDTKRWSGNSGSQPTRQREFRSEQNHRSAPSFTPQRQSRGNAERSVAPRSSSGSKSRGGPRRGRD